MRAGTVRTCPKVPLLLLSGVLWELKPAWSGTSAPDVLKGRASALNKSKVHAGLPGLPPEEEFPCGEGQRTAPSLHCLSLDSPRGTFPLGRLSLRGPWGHWSSIPMLAQEELAPCPSAKLNLSQGIQISLKGKLQGLQEKLTPKRVLDLQRPLLSPGSMWRSHLSAPVWGRGGCSSAGPWKNRSQEMGSPLPSA